ncbi:hypothetical protein EV361DRAFT_926209, partial [Lentinula raphanica]
MHCHCHPCRLLRRFIHFFNAYFSFFLTISSPLSPFPFLSPSLLPSFSPIPPPLSSHSLIALIYPPFTRSCLKFPKPFFLACFTIAFSFLALY